MRKEQVLSLKIAKELKEDLQDTLKGTGISMSAFIRMAIINELKKMKAA